MRNLSFGNGNMEIVAFILGKHGNCWISFWKTFFLKTYTKYLKEINLNIDKSTLSKNFKLIQTRSKEAEEKAECEILAFEILKNKIQSKIWVCFFFVKIGPSLARFENAKLLTDSFSHNCQSAKHRANCNAAFFSGDLGSTWSQNLWNEIHLLEFRPLHQA